MPKTTSVRTLSVGENFVTMFRMVTCGVVVPKNGDGFDGRGLTSKAYCPRNSLVSAPNTDCSDATKLFALVLYGPAFERRSVDVAVFASRSFRCVKLR